MTDMTRESLQKGIAKIQRSLDAYAEVALGEPTYEDESELKAALAAIEHACFALRLVQSEAMAENRNENAA